MARFGFIRFVCFLLTGLWSLSTLGQDVADRPDLQLGDEWIFVQTGSEDGKPVNRPWRRQIVEILPDDKIRVTPKYGGVDVFDRSWNPRHPERPSFWPLDFQFPLSVGAQWSFASPFGASTTNAENFDQRGHYKVVALESISVPGGTFKCFRIEGESSWLHGYAYSPDWHYVERWLITNWYCPDIRYIAKSRIERHISGSLVKATYAELDSELLVFKPGKPIPPVVGTSAAPTDPPSSELSPYDGDWTVSLDCVAIEEFPAAVYQWRVKVRGGEFILQAGSPDRPGYWRVAGRPSADGTLALNGTGISPVQANFGSEYVAHLRGRKSGAQFVLDGFFGARKCAMTLARAAAS